MRIKYKYKTTTQKRKERIKRHKQRCENGNQTKNTGGSFSFPSLVFFLFFCFSWAPLFTSAASLLFLFYYSTTLLPFLFPYFLTFISWEKRTAKMQIKGRENVKKKTSSRCVPPQNKIPIRNPLFLFLPTGHSPAPASTPSQFPRTNSSSNSPPPTPQNRSPYPR